MPDEKPYKYEDLPIPTYEEATSSRAPTPSLARLDEPSNEEEREGLISNVSEHRQIPTRGNGYRPAAVDDYESPRDSLDDVDFLPVHDDRHLAGSEDEEVRQEMQEMEVLDPPVERSTWTKRISSISKSLSFIHLPFNVKMPNWKFKWPHMNANVFILIGRLFAVILVMAVVYLIFISGVFRSTTQGMTGQMYDPESVRMFVQSMVSEDKIRGYLNRITDFNHIAGTEGDFISSQLVEGYFAKANLENVRTEEYYVYLNYPKVDGRAVELLGPDGSVRWAAKIEEEQAYTNPPRQQSMVFHGHSRSGDVKGPLIYANYGSREDFKRLHDSGIETKGAIALVRYYGSQGDRALKVKAAELAGFSGCIIYSDPADDGFLKGDVFPHGRYMPADGVQRGAVSLMSWVVGDVLTPGWASKKGVPRMSKDNNPGLPNIPSIPLAWRDAQSLLQAVRGFGFTCSPEWKGGVPDIDEWWSGNLSSPTVHLKNKQDEVEQQPIWNVIGAIRGVEQAEKSIIVGNHRDAWTFGASDPGSGTAVLLEVVRIFGMLMSRGWRPLRTIEFASWDAEEYNLIGSTEWVEDNIDSLRRDAYAYLNVDVAVSGQEFRAAASPVYHKALLRVLGRTSDPFVNETLHKLWNDRGDKLEGLGAGSDYVAFQDMAGTSSIDFGFTGPPHPYHSVYDNFEWMDQYGDPGFHYHKLVAQIWALLILEMADRPVLPFDMIGYSNAINQYAIDLEKYVGEKRANQEGQVAWSIEPLKEAVLQFQQDALVFEQWESTWERAVYASGEIESSSLSAERTTHNNRMAEFETNLLDLEKDGGLPGRTQFKHILFAPQAWSGYDEAFFPGIRDAVDDGDWALAQKLVEKYADILKKASDRLADRH